ncbi:MAG TPA: HRDC domain-containing protein [Egibacteraceae bacterium]
MPLHEYELVDDEAALGHALDRLASLDPVGVDVERADWNRYYRAPALIQVGGQGRVVLVDPIRIPELKPLHDFLAQRTVVLHAMENDLSPLAAVGVTPVAIEDTAVAAAILGLPTGLEALLREVLGVSLDADKQAMQRANWEERPLSEKMLRYAAGDVADLPALWQALAERLEEAGRTSWYREERDAIRQQPPAEERREWTRTKGAGRLDPAARARLRALWDVREELGRATDTAPGRIANDRVLVDLAVSPPAAASELGRRGVRRQAVRDFGEELMAALRNGDALAEEPGSRPRSTRPSEAHRAAAERLRALRAERARQLGIDPGVLCPSRTLLAAVATDPSTPEELRDALGLRSWQWEQLGAAFCEALALDGPGKPPPVTAPTPADQDDADDRPSQP